MKKLLVVFILVCLPFLCGAQTYSQVYNYLDRLMPQYRDEVLSIVMYETGYLTSYSLRTDKNLFGMQCPRKRDNVVIGCRYNKEHEFAQYDKWQHSVIDFIMWLEYFKKLRPINNYKNFFYWLRACGWNVKNESYWSVISQIKIKVIKQNGKIRKR